MEGKVIRVSNDRPRCIRKEKRMDAPIYIHHTFYEESQLSQKRPPIRNRLYVIEGRDGAAGEEVLKTDHQRVGVFNLPDLDGIFFLSRIFVANSRLFIVGGSSHEAERNGIRYVDFQHKDSSWEKSALPDDFFYVGGMAVLDGARIDGFGTGGKRFSFYPHDVKPSISSLTPPGRDRFPFLLAVTPTNKLFVFWAFNYSTNVGELGYYDLNSPSWQWHCIDPDATWPESSKTVAVVVGRKEYLISFVRYHPITQEYGPALYVYDTRLRKWLPKPVQGLPHDNNALPILNPDILLNHSSVMQVGALNFALVWSVLDQQQRESHQTGQGRYYCQLHCTKFTLSIQDEDEDTLPPTLCAQHLSSACFYSDGRTVGLDSTTATALSLEEAPKPLNQMKKRRTIDVL